MTGRGGEAPVGPAPADQAIPADHAIPADQAIPAGWRPDPHAPERSRWWDGAHWTWSVTDGPAVAWDPLPADPRPSPPGVPGVGVALAGFGAGVVLSLVVILVLRALGIGRDSLVRLPLSEAGLWVGLLVSCLLVSRRRGTRSWAGDVGLRWRTVDLAFGLAGALVGRMMASLALFPFSALLARRPAPDKVVFNPLTHSATGWLILALVTCVGAPLVEELFFRGLIQTRLVARWGPVTGIGVTSLMFGAAHLIGWAGPVTFLYAWSIAAGGVALGTVRHLTGRLATSMVAHALFNAQALVVLALLSRLR